MIGHFITRGLVMILGYAYPAYECFKAVEMNKPEIEQLRFWCQYWILVAMMTVFERVGDTFVSWVPMYNEAKLAFIIYLWYPKTKGTTYVYDSFFKPYVTKHETEIDRNLLELRTLAGDMTYMYCQKAACYGQTRIFEILQYVAARSTPRPQPTQAQQEAPRPRRRPPAAAAAAPHQPPTRFQATQPPVEKPMSPTSSTSSSQEKQVEDELSSTQGRPTSASTSTPTPTPLKKLESAPPALESSSQSATNNAEGIQIEPVPPRTEESRAKSPPPPPPEGTVVEETTRGAD